LNQGGQIWSEENPGFLLDIAKEETDLKCIILQEKKSTFMLVDTILIYHLSWITHAME